MLLARSALIGRHSGKQRAATDSKGWRIPLCVGCAGGNLQFISSPACQFLPLQFVGRSREVHNDSMS